MNEMNDILTDHFDYLNTFEEEIKKEEIKKEEITCCEKTDNYQSFNGQIKCKVCSNIISNIIDNPEWRYYGNKDSKMGDPTRCGMPVNNLLPESSVGSTVSFKGNNKTMSQIRKYQQWNGMPYKERSLYKVFLKIQGICERNHISSKIISESKSLYSIISETKISRGSNREGIIAACVYFACKQCNVPRSSTEISEIFDLNKTTMTKGIKKCQEIIFMNKNNKDRLSKSDSIKPSDFIERFCNKLDIDENNTSSILKICNIAIENDIISENTPPSIASGCIYYYIKKKNINKSKKDLSEVCLISEVTINKCCKKLETIDRLFNDILYPFKDNCNN